jgi:hypothetical protein
VEGDGPHSGQPRAPEPGWIQDTSLVAPGLHHLSVLLSRPPGQVLVLPDSGCRQWWAESPQGWGQTGWDHFFQAQLCPQHIMTLGKPWSIMVVLDTMVMVSLQAPGSGLFSVFVEGGGLGQGWRDRKIQLSLLYT